MDFFLAGVQAIPSVAQAVIIGIGFMRAIMKHTIRYNPKRCFDFEHANEADFPCMDVVAGRVHRFIASVGLFLTAAAASITGANPYLRAGDIFILIGVGVLYGVYMLQEKDRGQMEQPPKGWYDTNREILYALAYAAIGVALSIASQQIK